MINAKDGTPAGSVFCIRKMSVLWREPGGWSLLVFVGRVVRSALNAASGRFAVMRAGTVSLRKAVVRSGLLFRLSVGQGSYAAMARLRSNSFPDRAGQPSG